MGTGRRHRIVPAERQHLSADIAAAEFQRGWIAFTALTDAKPFDGDDVVYLDSLLTLVERIIPGRDRRVRAVERTGWKFDVIKRSRGACDKVAVSGAVRDERVRVQVIHEFVDETVVLFELIGECGSGADEREARCNCCQPAD